MPEWLLNTLEFLFLAAFVAGIALIYVPAAFIVGGLIGAALMEVASQRQKTEKAKP